MNWERRIYYWIGYNAFESDDYQTLCWLCRVVPAKEPEAATHR